MERTTLYLDDELKRRLREAATLQGTTEAAIMREALAKYLDPAMRARVHPVGRSTDGGVARRLDDALGDHGFGKP